MLLHLRTLRLRHLLLLVAIACTLPACEEAPDSEIAIQKSISSLFDDLQNATASNNIESLEQIIKSANRIRPSLHSQTQSKNLLLATAKEKLAKLQFQNLSAQSLAITTSFTLAENQAYQVAILRSAANSIAEASEQTRQSVTSDITSKQDAKQDRFDNQLSTASALVSNLDSESQNSRDKQFALREEAEQLLNNAEDAGIIDGHKTYKFGIRTLRKSQALGMSAAAIELQYHMQAIPMRDDARAELEAIASILNGMNQTDRLLQKLQDSSVQSAADFREIASQLDAQTAETMNDALLLGTELTQDWSELANLVQESMKGPSRGGSRDTQKTSSIWKLELEWTLGQVEEAKRTLLVEEARAVNALVEYGIVTSSDKWREISISLASEIEQATISAISAYENAKLLASNVGSSGSALLDQLETRRALLSGEKVPVPADAETAPTSSTSVGSVGGSGFSTPQELITVFNNSIDLSTLDGTTPATNLSILFVTKSDESKQFVTLVSNMFQAMGNILIAIRANIGEDAVQELLESNPIPTRDIMSVIDPNSIVVIDETSASAREVKSGKVIELENTNQGWKVVMGADSDENSQAMMSMLVAMFKAITDAMNSVAAQVNNGELTSIDEVNAAMEKAMENTNPF